MRKLSIVISEALDGLSVKSILEHELQLSDSLISRIKLRPTGILLNGVRAYTTARVCAGDLLCAQIGDDPAKPRAVPMPMHINILWQDEDIAVIDKPAGIAVHSSTRDPNELTLENAMAACLAPDEYFHPVSRLDRGTTGLMAVAKNGYMHERLRRLLHTPAFRREYRGIAIGTVTPKNGSVALPIGFAEGSTYKRAVSEGGAAALTEYQTLQNKNGLTLLRLIPHTGRTHQLRLHMAAIGYPLAGDWLYGERDDALISRPALHSYELWLEHPLTGEMLHILSELPEDMKRLLQ